ncbi:MAG: hypothetical protein M3Z19_17760, partial [Chloroflexota bacterium]|nr:hypothetical protein [Chloroflexota bacterium]
TTKKLPQLRKSYYLLLSLRALRAFVVQLPLSLPFSPVCQSHNSPIVALFTEPNRTAHRERTHKSAHIFLTL